jgi:hypothetical protein
MSQTARRSLVALGVVSTLALQGCALLFPPFPIFRMSGQDFEDIFSRALGCPTHSMIKMFKDAGLKGPFRCTQTSDALLVLILQKQMAGTPANKYLRSKGGTCTDLSRRTWRCVVTREVTATGYMGDTPTGPPRRIVFTLKVELHEDGRLHTDIDREDFLPAGKREPQRK